MVINIITIYIVGMFLAAMFWMLQYMDNEAPPFRIARLIFWPVFAARGLWRSWKKAWKEE